MGEDSTITQVEIAIWGDQNVDGQAENRQNQEIQALTEIISTVHNHYHYNSN